jgi:hypothetical protein
MSKREPQIILKTDERKVLLELGLEGKFAAKSTGWDENRVFLEGDRLVIEVKSGRWVLIHEPAKPAAPKLGRSRITDNQGLVGIIGFDKLGHKRSHALTLDCRGDLRDRSRRIGFRSTVPPRCASANRAAIGNVQRAIQQARR